jgi:hypothetical protein
MGKVAKICAIPLGKNKWYKPGLSDKTRKFAALTDFA